MLGSFTHQLLTMLSQGRTSSHHLLWYCSDTSPFKQRFRRENFLSTQCSLKQHCILCKHKEGLLSVHHHWHASSLPAWLLCSAKQKAVLLDTTLYTAPPEVRELGSFIEHWVFSTHVLSSDNLHIHAKCFICSSCAMGCTPPPTPVPQQSRSH